MSSSVFIPEAFVLDVVKSPKNRRWWTVEAVARRCRCPGDRFDDVKSAVQWALDELVECGALGRRRAMTGMAMYCVAARQGFEWLDYEGRGAEAESAP